MGKKIHAEMEAQREIFTEGATERGIDAGQGHRGLRPDGQVRRLRLQQVARRRLRAGRLPDRLAEGEPPRRLHRGLDDAWISTRPTSWPATCRRRARLGIRVLPPDINRSGADFVVETTEEGKPAIRFALAAVKRVGAAAMEALVAGARRQPLRRPRRLRRSGRSAAAEQDADREPGQGRRLRQPGEEPRPAVRRRRGHPAPRPGRRRGKRQRARSRCSAARIRGPSRCACRRCRIGRNSRSCLRGGGGRLPPLGASAGCLQVRRCDASA